MDDIYYNHVEALRRRRERDRVINVRDAIIEEIFFGDGISYVTISYEVFDNNYDLSFMEIVTLVVDRNTVIRNQRGRRINDRDLRVGNVVDASFSAAMTRSIPPQSRAFRITVVSDFESPMPVFPIVEDWIVDIDLNNRFLLTGNPDDIMTQMRFVVDDRTEIFDRRGKRIRLRDLRPGQMVRIEHADFMTMSIPPQTTAFTIWVL